MRVIYSSCMTIWVGYIHNSSYKKKKNQTSREPVKLVSSLVFAWKNSIRNNHLIFTSNSYKLMLQLAHVPCIIWEKNDLRAKPGRLRRLCRRRSPWENSLSSDYNSHSPPALDLVSKTWWRTMQQTPAPRTAICTPSTSVNEGLARNHRGEKDFTETREEEGESFFRHICASSDCVS
jgi:hypothetical protein